MSVYGGLVPLGLTHSVPSVLNRYYSIVRSWAQPSIFGIFRVFPGFFVVAAYAAVNQQTHQGQKQRSAEHQGRKKVAFSTQGAAAYGGGEYRGKPPCGTQQQPGAPAEVREPGEVAQQVLGGAGDGENEPKEEVALGGAFEKMQLIQLLRREKDLHYGLTQAAHQPKNGNAA